MKFVIALTSLLIWVSGKSESQICMALAPPVKHPVSSPPCQIGPAPWKEQSGKWGEYLVSKVYELRGFNRTYEIKYPGGQGLDHLAVKYDNAGNLIDVRFGETKTHYGGKARLSRTKLGPQMSRKWLADKLQAMRNSSDPELRELARDIVKLIKEKNVPIETLGEIHDVNTQTGIYTCRNAVTGEIVPDSPSHIPVLLKKIKKYSNTKEVRDWSKNSLKNYSKIINTGFTDNENRCTLRGKLLHKARSKVTGTLKKVAAKRTVKSMTKIAKIAGPIGSLVAVSVDAYEMYSLVKSYREGSINHRQLVIGLSEGVGGIAGGAAGAILGSEIGAMCGPAAPVTVPLFAAVGCGLGYLVGQTAGGGLASSWYEKIDESVKNGVNEWMLGAACPAFK